MPQNLGSVEKVCGRSVCHSWGRTLSSCKPIQKSSLFFCKTIYVKSLLLNPMSDVVCVFCNLILVSLCHHYFCFFHVPLCIFCLFIVLPPIYLFVSWFVDSKVPDMLLDDLPLYCSSLCTIHYLLDIYKQMTFVYHVSSLSSEVQRLHSLLGTLPSAEGGCGHQLQIPMWQNITSDVHIHIHIHIYIYIMYIYIYILCTYIYISMCVLYIYILYRYDITIYICIYII